MDNPYIREMDGKITKKEFKNGKSYLQLDKTIFYPDLAGGQPMDYGMINGHEVLKVYEEGNDIVHIVKGELNSNRVHMEIDWERRFDLMQQHSGEHLLASSFYRLFNATNAGIHIGNEINTIEIEKPYLTEDEAKQAEFLANKVIQSNFRVKSYTLDRDQLSRIPLRKETSIEDKNIRIIEIENIDYAACCGTHISNTGEIGIIKILKWYKYKGNIKIEFICGTRALKDYYFKNHYINKIGTLLSAQDIDVLERVNKLYSEKEALEEENKNLRQELYKVKGEQLLREVQKENKINFIIKSLEKTNSREINIIASDLNKNQEKLIQIYSIPNDEMGQFLISRSKDLNINLKEVFEEVSKKIIIKGGGSSQQIQGSASINTLDKVMDMFKIEIKKRIKG